MNNIEITKLQQSKNVLSISFNNGETCILDLKLDGHYGDIIKVKNKKKYIVVDTIQENFKLSADDLYRDCYYKNLVSGKLMSEDLICDLLDAADFVDNDFEKMLILNQVFKLDPDNISASIEITNLKDDKNIILNDLLKLEKYQKKKLATNDKTEFYSYMEILDEIINVYESKFNDTLTALKYARKLNEIDYDNTWNIDQDYIRLMLKAKKFNQLKNHIGRDIDHFESYALLHVYKHYNNKHNIKALLSSLHDYQLEILLDYNELINEANYYNDFALFIVNSDDEKLTAYFELKNYLEKLEY